MVAFGDGEGRFVRPCLHVGGLGNYGQGAREFSALVNGVQVVVCSLRTTFDYIIAVVPFVTARPGVTPVDFVQQAGGAHFFTEAIQRFPAVEQEGVINAACGGLLDIFPGDWGVINELGLGLFVGRFEALIVDCNHNVVQTFVDLFLRPG